MFGSIGGPELLVILVVALLIFGPRKLPQLGRTLGRSMAELRRASNDLRVTLDREIRLEDEGQGSPKSPGAIPAGGEPLRVPPPEAVQREPLVGPPAPSDDDGKPGR